jgi:O-antigen/teichoic acid export membrane protein
LYSSDRAEKLRRTYVTLTKWVLYVTFLEFTFTAVFAEDILTLFGTPTEAAAFTLVVLAVGQTITASTGPVGYLLTMSEYERLVTANTIAVSILNVILNYVLIARFGIVGAGLATGTSLALLNLLALVESWYFLGIFPYRRGQIRGVVGVLLVTACVMLPFKFAIEPSLLKVFVAGPLSVMIFGLLMLRFGVEDEDRELIDSLK